MMFWNYNSDLGHYVLLVMGSILSHFAGHDTTMKLHGRAPRQIFGHFHSTVGQPFGKAS